MKCYLWLYAVPDSSCKPFLSQDNDCSSEFLHDQVFASLWKIARLGTSVNHEQCAKRDPQWKQVHYPLGCSQMYYYFGLVAWKVEWVLICKLLLYVPDSQNSGIFGVVTWPVYHREELCTHTWSCIVPLLMVDFHKGCYLGKHPPIDAPDHTR